MPPLKVRCVEQEVSQRLGIKNSLASKKKSSTHARPTQKIKSIANKTKTTASLDRLERHVVCGRLFYPDCEAANADLPLEMPISFTSADHYISTYEPLIFEEIRENLLKAKLDNFSYQTRASIVGLDALSSNSYEIRIQVEEGHPVLREGAVIILSTLRLPIKANIEWLVGKIAKAQSSRYCKLNEDEVESYSKGDFLIAGIVRSCPSPGRGGTIALSVYPQCPVHVGHCDTPCSKAIHYCRPGRNVIGIVLNPMTVLIREFTALHKVHTMAVGDYLLHPEKLANFQTKNPYNLSLPEEVCEIVNQRLSNQYDLSQYEAIVAATCHLDGQEKNLAMPFTLICGPPGTGKTHTVCGILNVWHLSHYTRHQNSLMLSLHNKILEDLKDNSSVNLRMSSKPRLLICTPSNAAADELLQRVMTSGFIGNDGNNYFPNVVRVGAPGANIGERARAVLVDDLVKDLLNMDPYGWLHQVQRVQLNIQKLTEIINALQSQLALMEATEADGSVRDRICRQELGYARQLVERFDQRAKEILQYDRLTLIADHVHRRPGLTLSEVRDSLESSFIQDAEMVFSTLSSTGRKVFTRLPPGHFETVLIDEAAQASEITTLQALTFGCQRVVLVGDPQQLPATVISQRNKDLLLDRSLFERLQKAGCPVHMLTTQYRMHASIRDFPSKHFYDNKLKDGCSVTNRPSEVFYKNEYLQPYLFFDVCDGQDSVVFEGNNAGSRRNQAEADLAVGLFQVLREELIYAMQRNELRKPVVVGIITPYREQVVCIQETLLYVLGPQLAAEVDVSTVDSYQGRQLDAIIVSCVRANPTATGVGFVNDMRRMNVSITRAKRALWILGSAATLSLSTVWSALIKDAENRKCLIPSASCRNLFPHLPQFKEDFVSPAGVTNKSGQEDLQFGNFDRPIDNSQRLLEANKVYDAAFLMEELSKDIELPEADDVIPGLKVDKPIKKININVKEAVETFEDLEGHLYGQNMVGDGSMCTLRKPIEESEGYHDQICCMPTLVILDIKDNGTATFEELDNELKSPDQNASIGDINSPQSSVPGLSLTLESPKKYFEDSETESGEIN